MRAAVLGGARPYRYTGARLGYNLAGILGGAVPPLLAAVFVANGNVMYVGVMLAGLSAVSVLCAYLMVETKDRRIVDAVPAVAESDRGDGLAGITPVPRQPEGHPTVLTPYPRR